MSKTVPYCLEDILRKNSHDSYSAGEPFQSYVVTDDNLITGQNPASSELAARALMAGSNRLRSISCSFRHSGT